MGNQFIGDLNQNTKDLCELYLEDLGGISSEKILANGRLLTSAKCWNDEGYYVVVKVYVKKHSLKQDKLSAQENDTLSEVNLKFIEMNKVLSLEKQPNILPYFRVLETDKAAYLVRQYCYINLTDRISTRPFLRDITKKWLTFQILKSLKQLHDINLHHGDLKSDNCVLTGWDWLFINDLAPFKPLTLSTANTQSIFAYFFDTSERRKTTIAPERLCDKIEGNEDQFTKKIDVFSAGCVISQLFMEGRELFEFSQLLEYKNGKKNHVETSLKEIEDKNVRNLLKNMIHLDPKKRYTSDECLVKFKKICPAYFDILHGVMSKMLHKTCGEKLKILEDLYDDLITMFNSKGKIVKNNVASFMKSGTYKKKNKKVERVKSTREMMKTSSKEAEEVMVKLIEETKELNKLIKDKKISEFKKKIEKEITKFSLEDIKSRKKSRKKSPDSKKSQKEVLIKDEIALEGMDIIATLLCTSVRNAKDTNGIIAGLNLMRRLSINSTDYTRLQRLVPYTCTLLNGRPPLVKVTAIKALAFILQQVKEFPTSENNLFSDYILSTLKPLASDESDMVRICIAEYIPIFAQQSKRYLEIEQLLIRKNASKNDSGLYKGGYDEKLENLRNSFISIVSELTKDTCVYVKITLLKNISIFCRFCQRRKSVEEIIIILITFLNSNSWRLRAEFFQRIARIGEVIGITAIKKYILPCIFQSIYDSEEFVVDSVLHAIVSLTESHLLKKEALFELSKKISPLLLHPNTWIRYDSIGFFCAMAKEVGKVDTFCYIIPALQPYFDCELTSLTEYSMLSGLKEALKRDVYNTAIKRLLNFNKRRSSILIWSDLLSVNLSKDEVGKLEELKEYIFLSGSTLRRKTLKQSFIEEELAIKNDLTEITAPVKHLTEDVLSFKELEFPRKFISHNKGRKEEVKISEQRTGFRPEGELYCESREHKDSINSIYFFKRGNLLVTGSKDYSIKIWDIGGVDRKKSFSLVSKMTYVVDHSAGYITSVSCYPRFPHFVFSTSKGWIQVFNASMKTITDTIVVNEDKARFVPKINPSYSTMDSSFEFGSSVNVVKTFSISNSTVILAGTQSGKVVALDNKDHSQIFELATKNSLKEGPISAICGQDVWMVCGTKRGFITLWDLRFQMPITTWRINPCAINDVIVKQNVGKNLGPSIYIANSSRNVFGWNLETNRVTSVFRSSDPNDSKVKYNEMSHLRNKLKLEKTKEAQKLSVGNVDVSKEVVKAQKAFDKIKSKTVKKEKLRIEDEEFEQKKDLYNDPFAIKEIEEISWDDQKYDKYETKSLFINPEDGSFFSAGTDRRIRLWDVNSPNNSYVISGLNPNERSIYKQFRTENQLPIVKEYIFEQRNENEKHGTFNLPLSTQHMDSILGLTVITNQQNVKKLVSADKEGILKFFN